jgi:hypothetical protein
MSTKFIHYPFLELAQRVIDLNHRIADIRREQGYQRVSITQNLRGIFVRKLTFWIFY